MRKVLKNVFMKPEDVELIDKDINARREYMIFANQEKGTIEIELTLGLQEVFVINEDTLDEILDNVIVAADNKEALTKKEEVKALLRQAMKQV